MQRQIICWDTLDGLSVFAFIITIIIIIILSIKIEQKNGTLWKNERDGSRACKKGKRTFQTRFISRILDKEKKSTQKYLNQLNIIWYITYFLLSRFHHHPITY